MTVGSFVLFSHQKVGSLFVIMWRDAPLSTIKSRFHNHNLTEMRQIGLEFLKASAALTIETETIQIFQNNGVWLLLHHDDGFVPSRVEPLHIVVVQFDLQMFMEGHNKFARVADLKVLYDHPSDLPSW